MGGSGVQNIAIILTVGSSRLDEYGSLHATVVHEANEFVRGVRCGVVPVAGEIVRLQGKSVPVRTDDVGMGVDKRPGERFQQRLHSSIPGQIWHYLRSRSVPHG
jgi:hypothetical protein